MNEVYPAALRVGNFPFHLLSAGARGVENYSMFFGLNFSAEVAQEAEIRRAWNWAVNFD